MTRIALIFLAALLVVPFYIGPELAPNAQLNAERFLLVLLAASLIDRGSAQMFFRGSNVLLRQRALVAVTLTAYFLLRFISALFSPFPVSVLFVVNEIASQLFVFLVFFSLFLHFDLRRQIGVIFALSIFLILLIVLVELAFGQNFLTSLAPEGAGTAINNQAIVRSGLLRVKGTFEHPLTLAHMVVMILPVLLFSSLGLRPFVRIAAILSLILMGLSTGSRTLVVLMVLELGIWSMLRPIRFNTGATTFTSRGVALLLGPIAIGLAIYVAQQISGTSLFESGVRSAQIRNGMIGIQAKPWFGYGPGPGAIAAITDGMRGGVGAMRLWRENLSTVDNWFLSVLLSSGFTTFFAFLALIAAILAQGKDVLLEGIMRARLAAQGMDSLAIGLWLGCLFGAGFMAVLSIFTLHPLFYILAAWLTALVTRARLSREDAR